MTIDDCRFADSGSVWRLKSRSRVAQGSFLKPCGSSRRAACKRRRACPDPAEREKEPDNGPPTGLRALRAPRPCATSSHVTVKVPVLVAVPPGVVTAILPVFAPVGTVAVIWV